jgi:hypothetical protein
MVTISTKKLVFSVGHLPFNVTCSHWTGPGVTYLSSKIGTFWNDNNAEDHRINTQANFKILGLLDNTVYVD